MDFLARFIYQNNLMLFFLHLNLDNLQFKNTNMRKIKKIKFKKHIFLVY